MSCLPGIQDTLSKAYHEVKRLTRKSLNIASEFWISLGKHGLGDIWHFDRLMESLVDIFIGDGGVEELKGRLFDLEFFYWMARSFRVFDRVRNE